MHNIEFTNIFLSLWGIAGLIFWTVNYFNFFKVSQIYLPNKSLLKKTSRNRLLLYFVGLCAWILISYSLMGPRAPAGFADNTIKVNDIYFVVDVSLSMTATDFTPNRLEVAKKKIIEFIKLRPTDRIGIIIFSERVFTLLPLSTDLDLIQRIISDIKVKIGFLGAGTNIGDALGLAVARSAQSMAKKKVVILLTDGVSNVGSMTPLQAADLASKKNIKVYTIAIAGSKNAQIPSVGGRRGFARIPGGSMDTNTLDKIALKTNGKSFVAKNSKALKSILAEIEKLERTEIKSHKKVVYTELYLKYLICGVLLLLLTESTRTFVFRESL